MPTHVRVDRTSNTTTVAVLIGLSSLLVAVALYLIVQNVRIQSELDARVEAEVASRQLASETAELELSAKDKEASDEQPGSLDAEEKASQSLMEGDEKFQESELLRALSQAEVLSLAQEKPKSEAPVSFDHICRAKVDIHELLNEGRFIPVVTLVSPFGDGMRHVYIGHENGPPINLNLRSQVSLGSSEYAREVKVESTRPLTILVIPILKESFKEKVGEARRVWSKLKEDLTTWMRKFPDQRIDIGVLTKKDDFMSFRKRLNEWSPRYRKMFEDINSSKAELSKQSSDEQIRFQMKSLAETQGLLERINGRYVSLCAALDSIANGTVYDSGPIFYTSDGDEPIIPPGIVGREPFKFKYTIEYPVNSPSSIPVVESEISRATSPFIPQGPPLP